MSDPDEPVTPDAVDDAAVAQHTGYDRDKLIRELSATITYLGRITR